MSYYVVKVYGLVCDICEASTEVVPPIDEANKLAWARRQAARASASDNFRFVGGKDICPRRDARHASARDED